MDVEDCHNKLIDVEALETIYNSKRYELLPESMILIKNNMREDIVYKIYLDLLQLNNDYIEYYHELPSFDYYLVLKIAVKEGIDLQKFLTPNIFKKYSIRYYTEILNQDSLYLFQLNENRIMSIKNFYTLVIGYSANSILRYIYSFEEYCEICVQSLINIILNCGARYRYKNVVMLREFCSLHNYNELLTNTIINYKYYRAGEVFLFIECGAEFNPEQKQELHTKNKCVYNMIFHDDV